MLPVESVVAELLETLKHQDAILVAPPGAGKSTFLPLQLLKSPYWSGRKIIMLQPRRVAVRAIAEYLASQLGESVGQTVGYRIRGESKVSRDTRLEIVTEGLLTRKIQQDPELADVALILFDEFHERSIHADFSLALSLEIQQGLREDLRLLIMSATLDVLPLQSLLPQANVIQSEGRSYPVDVLYRPLPGQMRLSDWVAKVVSEAVDNHDGNLLVFLPGRWEIEKVAQLLTIHLSNHSQVCVFPLHGGLTKKQQISAIKPAEKGTRKVVLATNIAETSLTIDGISVVIDSGLEKQAVFNLGRGLTQLKQQMISQASSIQRMGRAGRLQAGVCYRLWEKEKQSRMAKQAEAEILRSDIAPLVIEAAIWGTELKQMALLDKPSAAQLQQTYALLMELQAIDDTGKLTGHGKKLAKLGSHPRLANMLIKAQELGDECAAMACLLVAILESNELTGNSRSASLARQIDWLCGHPQHSVWKMARQWAGRIKVHIASDKLVSSMHWVAVLIGFAYPDQIAKQRGDGKFLLFNGGGAMVSNEDPLHEQTWLAIADLILTDKADARVSWAEAIDEQSIQKHFSHLIKTVEECLWDEPKQKILSRKRMTLGAITLNSQTASISDSEQLNKIWCQVIRQKGIDFLQFPQSLEQWLAKLNLAHSLFPEKWPLLDKPALINSLEDWLAPYLVDITSAGQLKALDWRNIVRNLLDWQLQSQLDEWFPDKIVVPSGNAHKLSYEGQVVTLSVRMQEMYGLSDTPSVANGKIPLQIELLSPAGRPLQTTQDLAGFWRGSYSMVQKEMKGRYPKHFWPDDPARAVATTRTKKNM